MFKFSVITRDNEKFQDIIEKNMLIVAATE
jgi:hypothetical protein